MRKYFAEFGLDVSTSYKTLIPVEHLEEVNDGHKYHIYFILSCEKIFIEPDSIVQTKNGIFLKLYRIEYGEKSYYPDAKFALDTRIDHNEIKLECKFPYTTLKVEIDDEKKVTIDSQVILNCQQTCQPWMFNVLYVGQSYGKDGSRLAQERLLSHSTLQKILTDCNSKYPDKRIYIFLLELNPILNTTMDGISKVYSVSENDEQAHFKNVFDNPLKMNQIVNITEAALINYFKPHYNEKFVDNFPNTNHKGYTQYFDLDYHSLVVELDLEFDYPYPDIQFYSEANSIKSSWNFIEYNLHNDPNRSSMYELFSEKRKLTNL